MRFRSPYWVAGPQCALRAARTSPSRAPLEGSVHKFEGRSRGREVSPHPRMRALRSMRVRSSAAGEKLRIRSARPRTQWIRASPRFVSAIRRSSSTPTLRKARSWFFSFLEGRTIQPCPSTAWVAHRTTAGRGTFSTVRKNAELGRALVSFLPRSGSCEPCSWPRSENWRRKDDGLAALRELACTLDIIATANKALITARAGRKRVL